MTASKPDMANLRIIRDSELRLGEVIGSGAFGTVYAVSQHSARGRSHVVNGRGSPILETSVRFRS